MKKTFTIVSEVEKMDFTAPETKNIVLGILETLCENIDGLTKRVQDFEDEVNRLKGEKGKPTFKLKKEENINKKPKMEKPENKKWEKKTKRN